MIAVRVLGWLKVWEAEQKKTAAEKREKEMKELYEKEQERYRTR